MSSQDKFSAGTELPDGGEKLPDTPLECPDSPTAPGEPEISEVGEELVPNEVGAGEETEEIPELSRTQKFDIFLFDMLDSLVFAVFAAITVFSIFGRIAAVDGASMFPTLTDGEKLAVSGMFYTPAYGDIVIVTRRSDPEAPLVKRVIAVEGQTVDIDFENGVVYVDGNLLNEPYTGTPTNLRGDLEYPVTVPPGHVFLMGDNRNFSHDSRSARVGFADTRNIVGKVYAKVFPFQKLENPKQ